MKKIGIVFAMKEELEETIKHFKDVKDKHIFDLTIYECSFDKNKCYLLESGVGKVNAARSTQILISEINVDYVLNVGVAGSVSKNVNKCDIVVAENLVQHDFDITPFGYEKGFISNVGKFVECDKKLLEYSKKIELDAKIIVGTIASGDIFVNEEKMGRKIHDKFNALCVEMEGAAIAQVCYLCKVPFLVVRAISDSPYEDDNEITFDEFLKKSSDMVSKFAIQLIEKI